MMEMTDTPNDSLGAHNNPTRQREVFTYKQKRVWCPLIGSVGFLFLTAEPFVAFVTYVIFGLLYDFIVFKFEGCADSESIPDHQLAKEQITGKQYDRLNNFLVKVRQAAFALSLSTTAFSLLFFEAANYQFVFVATYISISVAAIFWGIKTNEIVYPIKESSKNDDKADHFAQGLISTPYNRFDGVFATSKGFDNSYYRVDDGIYDPCAPGRMNPYKHSD